MLDLHTHVMGGTMEHLETRVAQHYSTTDLLARIDDALRGMGVDRLTIDDLKPVDEFHTGGLEATDALLSQIEIAPGSRVIDIGCGLGGTARHILHRYGARVTGVDLTPAFVEAGAALNERLSLGEGVKLLQGSALDLPVAAGTFDTATMFHVGMNISDKNALMAEVARVLRPGGTFVLFDVMRDIENTPLVFPLPWAETAETSFVESPLAYSGAAEHAGLEVAHRRDRRDFTLTYFHRVFETIEADGLPPLGIHLLMGDSAGEKLKNYVENVEARRIAPVEMIIRKPR